MARRRTLLGSSKRTEAMERHVAERAATIRGPLLREVLKFVDRAQACPGVCRIALLGSLVTEKDNPKDADLLVTVADDADLASLATAGRRLKGAAQSRNCGADIFLANRSGEYIGRTCHWKECRPGIRLSCDALNCGRRPYLHDDLEAVRLEADLVREPPIELWPEAVRRTAVPPDVETILLGPLEA
jgi:predicted nucleotidyltransferase